MAEFRVFYSWQSDLPNSTNRAFIEKALEKAAKSIGTDASVEVEPVIDRDTAGVPGTPDIAHAILEKIDASDVFACDVSIINAGQESRPTPNPNVLIELGYAFKSLGPSRILLIMNTAFGGPELLPFDLRMKRVARYDATEQDPDKSKERQRLSGELETALKTIITNAGQTATRTIPSGDKKSLKAECEQVLQRGDPQEWRDLANTLSADVPQRLEEWIKERAQTWDKIESDERQKARFEAVETCLPGFVPVFVAAEKGRKDAWKESISLLRELALLRDRVRAGFTDVLEIGSHMLYFAGNIGMAIAARGKQLALIREWLSLPMPTTEHGEPAEVPWLQVRDAHRLWGKYLPGNRAPFGVIVKACESDYLRPFALDGESAHRHLFTGNLVQSLFELGRWTEDRHHLKALESNDAGILGPGLNVWSAWGLMDPNEFRSATYALFGSAEGVRQFVFSGNGVSLDRLWEYWKKWKEICVSALSEAELHLPASRILSAGSLRLPGEPYR